jgi:hypothetical protein
LDNVTNIPSGGSSPAQIATAVWSLASGDYSSILTTGVGIAKPSAVSVRLEALDYSSVVTVGTGSIKAATYSGVTLGVNNIGAGTYSGVTVGINNATGDVSSRFTVSVSSLGVNVAQISGDATAADNLEAAFDGSGYSSMLTVHGVTNVANFPSSGGSSPAQIADAVWSTASGNYSSILTVGAGLATPSVFSVRLESLDYSSKVTVGVGSIKAATYSGVTVEAMNVSTDSAQIADRVWSTASGTLSALTIKGITNFSNLSGTFSGLTVRGLENYSNLSGDKSSILTVGVGSIAGGTYSDVTISGVLNSSAGPSAAQIADEVWSTASGDYSSILTVGVGKIAPAVYSGVTIGGSSFVTINPGTYSDVTVQTENAPSGGSSGVEVATEVWNAAVAGYTSVASFGGALSRFSSSVDSVGLKAQVHSQATVGGLANYSNLSGTFSNLTVRLETGVTYSGATVGIDNIAPKVYSGVTLGVNNIAAGSLAAGTVDAVALATDAVNEIADGLLDRNMATGVDSGSSTVRTARDALRALRNRVASDATQIYVFAENDSTVAWTASLDTVTSTANHISGFDPNA